MAALKNLSPAITTLADYNGFVLTDVNSLHVLYFWAQWDAPSQPGGAMDTLLSKLAELHPGVRFGRVEAEEAPEISEQFDVSAVPTFLFFKSKVLVDKVEGPDAAAATSRVEKWIKQAVPGSAGGAAAAAVPKSLLDLDAELDRLVNAQPVMLFMKGSPSEPKCGFSRKTVELLKEQGTAYGAFDILSNEAVRQGLKDKFNWPTFPQLYVAGKLIGGIDILKELKESGELDTILPKPPAPPASSSSSSSSASSSTMSVAEMSTEQLQAFLSPIINRQPVMLFMKGTPQNAACGFSERVVEVLQKANVDFGSFDVLSDPRVREGVKRLSDFPTFPQLYVRGELVGGVDVIKQMQEENPGKSIADLLSLPTKEPLNDKLKRLINQAPAVLFMKGNPDEPRCGFSARAIETLKECGLDVSKSSATFASFDILSDADVREGLKVYSNWPTFPQFYVDGALIGGLDIMKEMREEGELEGLVAAIKPRAQ